MKYLILYLMINPLLLKLSGFSGLSVREEAPAEITPRPRVYYGLASYYADRFQGRHTANGDIYDAKKMTAACNILPLGTWIRVTNLLNNRSVIVRTNDRLYVKVKRIVDLSRVAAEQLGYIKRGLAQVKVEVIEELEK
jgi:rare lipoprotein A